MPSPVTCPVPAGPGLGVDLDEEVAALAAYQPPGT
jgi:hypothetical protein